VLRQHCHDIGLATYVVTLDGELFQLVATLISIWLYVGLNPDSDSDSTAEDSDSDSDSDSLVKDSDSYPDSAHARLVTGLDKVALR